MNWLIACLLIMTGIGIYFPVVYIRKMNRVLTMLTARRSRRRLVNDQSAFGSSAGGTAMEGILSQTKFGTLFPIAPKSSPLHPCGIYARETEPLCRLVHVRRDKVQPEILFAAGTSRSL
jgi:hypothetical protein